MSSMDIDRPIRVSRSLTGGGTGAATAAKTAGAAAESPALAAEVEGSAELALCCGMLLLLVPSCEAEVEAGEGLEEDEVEEALADGGTAGRALPVSAASLAARRSAPFAAMRCSCAVYFFSSAATATLRCVGGTTQ